MTDEQVCGFCGGVYKRGTRNQHKSGAQHQARRAELHERYVAVMSTRYMLDLFGEVWTAEAVARGVDTNGTTTDGLTFQDTAFVGDSDTLHR